ncbi:MAG: acylphosphatase [Caulobacteraceae bacterium]|nr:acylphosphatase [Caulobacteraceae bacterium]
MARIAVRLVIRGRVQGVGYRWWARGQARRLKLAGWVRNRSDGSVELLAAGSSGAVEQLIEACRYGPPAAQVTLVERFEADDPGSGGFEERPTV